MTAAEKTQPALFGEVASFRVVHVDDLWCVVHEQSGLRALVALAGEAAGAAAARALEALPIDWSSITCTPTRWHSDGMSRVLEPMSMKLLRDLQYRCASNGGRP